MISRAEAVEILRGLGLEVVDDDGWLYVVLSGGRRLGISAAYGYPLVFELVSA